MESDQRGERVMKLRILRALPLVGLFTVAGCETSPNGYNYRPSEIEKAFLKECAPDPAVPPCGHH
jgi:hypothetical protein